MVKFFSYKLEFKQPLKCFPKIFLLKDKSVETAPWSEAPPDYLKLENPENLHGFAFSLVTFSGACRESNIKYTSKKITIK